MLKPGLFCFGSPRIEVNGDTATFHRRRALALAAYLAALREPQSREYLLALLWPAFEPGDARNNLRRELSHLRLLLGASALQADRAVVALNPEALTVDLWEFNAHLAAARAHAPEHPGATCETCARSLAAAVDLYAADFLDGFGLPDSAAFDEWQAAERERLRRLAIGALDQLVAWQAGKGEHERAAALAQRAISLEPFHEAAHRAVMRALALDGQRPAALRHYDRLHDRLADEISAPPEAETTALYDEIRTGTPASVTVASIANNKEETPLIRLPSFPTPFVGRQPTIDAITGLLDDPDTRLLTLAGPGGMGKTRLAVATAAAITRRAIRGGRGHSFDDGIVFASLAGLTTADAIPSVMAEALGFTIRGDGPPPARQLLDYLCGRRLLLVLDNIEHLLPGGEAFLAQITREALGVTLLVTSRTRLNISGERLFPVGGMDVPPEAENEPAQGDMVARYSSVALFIQAARRVRPDFSLTPGNSREVARICRRLGGMPLAIELAAAWLEALSPAEISAEIGHDLDFLTTDLNDIPNRQRSIRAIFDTSFRLLNERERATLPWLAVFADGFTREAAEAVVAAADDTAFLKTLLGLAHKSWLTRDPGGRFQIHELLRQYAMEQLGAERDTAQERHARYFARFLDQLWPRLYSGDQLDASGTMAADLNNILAAWMWFARRGEFGPVARQMLMPVVYYTIIAIWFGNYARLLNQTIGDIPPDTADLDRLILCAARAVIEINLWSADTSLETVWKTAAQLPDPAQALGVWYILLCEGYGAHIDRPAGLRELRRLVARYEPDDNWLLHYAQRSLGKLILADWRDAAEQGEAIDLLQKAAAGYARSGNVLFQSLSLFQIARNSAGYLSPEERLKLLDKLQTLLESVGRPGHTWDYAWHRMGIHIRLGKPEQVFADLEEQIDIARSKGNRLSEVQSLAWESTYARRYRSIDHSLGALRGAIAIAEKGEMPMMLAWCLWNMGEVLRMMGNWQDAGDYIARSERIFTELNDLMGLSYVEFGYGSLALDRADLINARERLERFVELSLTLPQNRWNQANSYVWLARADVALGRLEQAAQELREALRLIVLGQDYDVAPGGLAAVAELALAAGRPELFATLRACLIRLPVTWLETRAQLDRLSVPPHIRPAAVERFDLEETTNHLAALPDAPLSDWLDNVEMIVMGR